MKIRWQRTKKWNRRAGGANLRMNLRVEEVQRRRRKAKAKRDAGPKRRIRTLERYRDGKATARSFAEAVK